MSGSLEGSLQTNIQISAMNSSIKPLLTQSPQMHVNNENEVSKKQYYAYSMNV